MNAALHDLCQQEPSLCEEMLDASLSDGNTKKRTNDFLDKDLSEQGEGKHRQHQTTSNNIQFSDSRVTVFEDLPNFQSQGTAKPSMIWGSTVPLLSNFKLKKQEQ